MWIFALNQASCFDELNHKVTSVSCNPQRMRGKPVTKACISPINFAEAVASKKVSFPKEGPHGTSAQRGNPVLGPDGNCGA